MQINLNFRVGAISVATRVLGRILSATLTLVALGCGDAGGPLSGDALQGKQGIIHPIVAANFDTWDDGTYTPEMLRADFGDAVPLGEPQLLWGWDHVHHHEKERNTS